jgi:serine/threonine protein kinase
LAVKVMKGNMAPLNNMYSQGLRDLITKMLNITPKLRPAINEILSKSFVKKRVIKYITDILDGRYVENNNPQ